MKRHASYMNSQRIMSEGFLDKLLGNLSKTARGAFEKEAAQQKKARIKQLKSKIDKEVDNINKSQDVIEKEFSKMFSKKIKLKRYTAADLKVK